MDSFQAKIGWNSLRNRENNNYRSVPFRSNPTSNRNSKTMAKKLKSTIMDSFQAVIVWKRMRNREKKIIVQFRSYPMRNRKFQKNNKKTKKINSYHYQFISSQTRFEKDEKERNKNYRSVSFLPDA